MLAGSKAWLSIMVYGACLAIAGLLISDESDADVRAVGESTRYTAKRGSSNLPNPQPISATECDQRVRAAIAVEGQTRTTGGITYQCITTLSYSVLFGPTPVCPSKPADEQRTQVCPPPTVGTWLQDRVWTLQPAPTCWVLGEWTPAAPPTNMCGQPLSEWTRCATEGSRCSFTGTHRVRYGAGTTWIEATFTGGVPCTNHDFGRDPLPGTLKQCEMSGAVVPVLGNAPLSWRAPTTNTDGTALTNLAGYRVVYGQSIDALTQTVQIANPGVTSYALTGLAPGTYYFAVKAYTTGGRESGLSNLTMKVIQ